MAIDKSEFLKSIKKGLKKIVDSPVSYTMHSNAEYNLMKGDFGKPELRNKMIKKRGLHKMDSSLLKKISDETDAYLAKGNYKGAREYLDQYIG